MASRSRKRGRTGTGATPAAEVPSAAAPLPADPSAAPQPEDPSAAAAPANPEAETSKADPLLSRYARGRLRDDAIRASLEPLAPGERPGAVTVAAVVAFAFAIANVVATLTVDDLSSDEGDPTLFAIVTTAILVVTGAGMLARRYWAVLGFQCVLGLQITVFSLALLRVQKWWLALAMVAAIGLLGLLFWKLIRAMARLQMPQQRGAPDR